jgi:hypothetical protein
MEIENELESPLAGKDKKNSLSQVTPLSKYLAMLLFIALPFIGGWVGYTYAPEKIVEVEKVIVKEKVVNATEGITEPGNQFTPGQFVEFVGTVLESISDCGGGDTCFSYLILSLPESFETEDIRMARVHTNSESICYESSLRSGEIVKVSGNISNVVEGIGLVFSCDKEGSMQVTRVAE